MRPAVAFFSLVLASVGCGKVIDDGTDADPCATATCECTVATQDADCGSHEVCDESGPGRTCRCAPAYKEEAGACVFDAAPLDKGFQDPTKWTVVGQGAVVNIAAAGNLDPGEGVINRIGMCGQGGFKQAFTMPPRSKADAFKLAVTQQGVAQRLELFGTLTSVGVGGQFNDAPVANGVFRTDTFCLGPRAYGTGAGSPVDFVVGTFGGVNCLGTSSSTVNFDQLALQVAAPGECPDPGTVVDGDFEAAQSKWTFEILQGAIGAIQQVGDGGTKGAALGTVNRCSEVTMTGQIAFPAAETNANQAIEVSLTGNNGGRLVLQLDGKNIATLHTSGDNRKQHVCVPEWAVGTTTSIGFLLERDSDNACAVGLTQNFTIDNIKIVSDTACSSAEQLTDPGFERIANATGPASGWGATNGHVNDLEAGFALLLNAAGAARTGNGVLRLSGSNECVGVGDFGADTAFTVPPAQGTAGPALKFFASVPVGNVKTTTRVEVLPTPPGGGGTLDLPETGGYQPATLCLPPGLIGRRISVRFSTGNSVGGVCANSYPTEVAFIDDVSLTTDPSCPAQ